MLQAVFLREAILIFNEIYRILIKVKFKKSRFVVLFIPLILLI